MKYTPPSTRKMIVETLIDGIKDYTLPLVFAGLTALTLITMTQAAQATTDVLVSKQEAKINTITNIGD